MAQSKKSVLIEETYNEMLNQIHFRFELTKKKIVESLIEWAFQNLDEIFTPTTLHLKAVEALVHAEGLKMSTSIRPCSKSGKSPSRRAEQIHQIRLPKR
jgi:hypothetical protein